jgi:hypothetical protein
LAAEGGGAVIVLVDFLWLGGFVLAVVILGCGVLLWGMVTIGRVSDQQRMPPIDDTYTVEGEDEFGTPWSVPTKPGPERHLPGLTESPRSGPGEPPDGDRAV